MIGKAPGFSFHLFLVSRIGGSSFQLGLTQPLTPPLLVLLGNVGIKLLFSRFQRLPSGVLFTHSLCFNQVNISASSDAGLSLVHTDRLASACLIETAWHLACVYGSQFDRSLPVGWLLLKAQWPKNVCWPALDQHYLPMAESADWSVLVEGGPFPCHNILAQQGRLMY